MSESAHVLIVANRTAAGPALFSAVGKRAHAGPCRFHLVVPATPRGMHRVADPEVAGRVEAEQSIELAVPLLSEAAGSPVTAEVGSADPVAATHDAMHAGAFDEVIVSTLPRRLSRWLRLDLSSKMRHMGVPVIHVEAHETDLVTAIPRRELEEVAAVAG
jgi:hypothetical protein